MADKEERILITTRHKNEKLNMTFMDMYKEYTIQEAIERMAKSICKISCACKYYSCGNCTEFLEHYTPDLAEAALNSLLEDKK